MSEGSGTGRTSQIPRHRVPIPSPSRSHMGSSGGTLTNLYTGRTKFILFAKDYEDNQISERETGDACILIGTPEGKRTL